MPPLSGGLLPSNGSLLPGLSGGLGLMPGFDALSLGSAVPPGAGPGAGPAGGVTPQAGFGSTLAGLQMPLQGALGAGAAAAMQAMQLQQFQQVLPLRCSCTVQVLCPLRVPRALRLSSTHRC